MCVFVWESVQVPTESRDGVAYPDVDIISGCKLPCRSTKSSIGSSARGAPILKCATTSSAPLRAY